MLNIDFKYLFSEEMYRQFLTFANSKSCEYRLVIRARIIVEYFNTASVKETAANVGVDPQTASKWIKRVWKDPRVETLMDKHRSGKKKHSKKMLK